MNVIKRRWMAIFSVNVFLIYLTSPNFICDVLTIIVWVADDPPMHLSPNGCLGSLYSNQLNRSFQKWGLL